jgi:hypothetical protein
MKFTDATKPDRKSGGSRGTCSLCVAKRNPEVVVAPYTFGLPKVKLQGRCFTSAVVEGDGQSQNDSNQPSLLLIFGQLWLLEGAPGSKTLPD